MVKIKKNTDGEKVAKINGKFLIIVTLITVIGGGIFGIWKISNNGSEQSTIQKVGSGSINNYNADRDVKIENNTYNMAPLNVDSIKIQDSIAKYFKTPIVKSNSNQKTNIHEQTNVTSHNQSGGQTAKEIINNNY